MRQGQNAFNSERPLNVQPTAAGVSDFRQSSTTPRPLVNVGYANFVGGVARGGQADRPMGEPTLMDKVIGKAEKVEFHITSYIASLTITMCRSSEKLLGIRRGTMLESFVRRAGRRHPLARRARGMTE